MGDDLRRDIDDLSGRVGALERELDKGRNRPIGGGYQDVGDFLNALRPQVNQLEHDVQTFGMRLSLHEQMLREIAKRVGADTTALDQPLF